MKKITAIICTLLAAAMLSGCGGESESSAPSELIVQGGGEDTEKQKFPVTLSDGTVIESEPQSAASLSPAATEIVAELGYSGKLCAVSRYCDYPQGLVGVTVGSSENPDIDKLLELAPDVVFTMSGIAERERYTLNAAGIAVVELSAPENVLDYVQLYQNVGTAFGGEAEGTAAGEKAAAALASSAEGIKLGSFVYVTPKLTAAAGGTFENAVLSLCGKNICKGQGYTSDAEMLDGTPDYIIAADSLSESDISGNTLFSEMLSAGAKLVFVPAERFERPSARIADVFGALRNAVTSE